MANSIVKYALLSFPIASFGLGYWQIKRLEWKNSLVAHLEARLTQEPIDLLSIQSVEDLNTAEYKRVKARGKFDDNPDNQIYLRPRQLIVNDEALARGRTALQSNSGANVITPFQLDGTNLRVLVNRGWVPLSGVKDVAENGHLGLKSPNNESIDLVGIIRAPENRSTFTVKNNESTNVWQIRDIDAMSRVLGTAPIYIEADQNLSKGEGPIGGQTQLTVRNEHLNYAITWFTLTICSYLMWYTRYGKRGNALFRRGGEWR